MEQAVLERLAQLEHQSRRLRVMAWVAAAAVFVFLAIGFAPKQAITAESAQKSIVAKELSIVDDKGNPRIVLGIDPDTGPIVTLLNKKGDPAVSIGVVDKDGSSAVRLSDKNDKGGTALFLAGDGTSGMIVDDKNGVTCATVGVDPKSTPVVSLNSKDEKASAVLAVVDDTTPQLVLEDNSGNSRVLGPGE